jgi:hypothetical protein
MAFRKIEAGLVHADVDEFIGKTGTIFYDNSLGDFRISDGQTPGGIALSVGGGEGGNYSLPTATTTVKGGVKIDGTTIAITNQVIRVGTVPYSSLSGTPTIPTNNNELTNGAAYITSSALTGLATESYVTTRGYITTSALTDYALTSAVPTNNNQLSNGAAYITSSALTGLATETYVTTRGYLTTVAYADITNKPTLFSGSYADLTNKPTIPTDINQLADASGLLGQGGGGGGTTYITNNVENPFTFSIAGDDSTLREIANGESIKITGAGGITVTTDAEGNVTVTGTPVSLAGYATESYVNSRGYITGLSFNDLTDKPDLAGTYTFNVAADDSTLRTIGTEETVKFVGAGGITTASDDEGKITITQGTTSSLVNGAKTFGLDSNGVITFTGSYSQSPSMFVSTAGFALSKVYASGGSATQVDIGNNVSITVGIGDDEITGLETAKGWYFKTDGDLEIPGNICSEGNINIEVNLTDSTRRRWQFGEDGALTLPEGGRINAVGYNNIVRLGNDGFMVANGSIFNENETGLYFGGQNSDAGTYIQIPGLAASEAGEPLIISHQWPNASIDILGGGGIWSFGSDGGITFPDDTVQTTAWTGVADYNNLINKPNLASTYQFSVAADDSTQRLISTDETVKFIGASGITTASDAEGNITITGPSLAGLATETYVTTQGYITSSALTGLATETFVTTQGYITGLSYNDLTDKPNLAGTYSWSIAADDSTQFEIAAGNLVKIKGAGGITTSSDADGNITITGAAQDRLTSNARSAVLNSNGTFSLPTMTVAPTSPQAGQMALANGTSWDPIAQNNGAPYMVIYTGASWMGLGGVTMDQVYMAVLELGSAGV